ncbi:MAG: YhgE/Pip domain-containing protein [Firmicutes bacterium]|nr:YhgE/Pip domain-containing protein [Bacillota bacterium]
MQQLRQKLRSVSNELDSSADSLDNIYQINTSLTNLMKVTDVLLSETGSRTSDAVGELKSRELFSDSADGDLDALSGKIDEVLQNTEQAYGSIDSSVNSYMQDMNTDAATISASMNTFGDRVQTMIDHYQELQWGVEALSDSLPEGMNASRRALTDLSEMLDYSIRQQTRIRDTLREGASDLTSVSSDALQYKQDLSNYINQCDQDLENMRGRYRDEMKPQLQKLSESLTAVSQSVQTVSDGLGSTASEMKNAADSVSGQMDSMNRNLNDTGSLLRADAEKIRQILDQTDETGNAGGRELLKKLLNNDTDTVGSYFSSVVKLDSHVLYPVANFGTAMTPFYTCLAIWVGAVILVSMLQVNVSEKTKKTLKNEKNWQLYLGRYGIFLLFSLLQSLLIALGDLLYLGVPCAHPVPFVLTCMYTGFVFVTLIYTLTISFGNIGKAAAVIILVFQVAGSGGTLPIEMTPPFFHIFYPLLPVTHSMNAMRECIAGFYGSDYLHELAILSIYVWISLLLGLVLRNPMINMNSKFVEMVEDTKVM